ncbi:hypothetical protein ABI59_17920 [Acidobacteria bacterium Mor1]|nr:hypothetical protein ABI59_17920 [Acidobacteria bacterium Mor1]
MLQIAMFLWISAATFPVDAAERTVGFADRVAATDDRVAATDDRVVTLDDRVAAQQAIDQVYRRFTVGAAAIDPAHAEQRARRRVLEDLRLSLVVADQWGAAVTDAALQAELERIARDTRMPARLDAVYGALHRDPVMVREVFARSVLVRRLARRFFSADSRLQNYESWDTWWAAARDRYEPETSSKSAATLAPLPTPRTLGASTEAAACAPDDTWTESSLDDHPDPRHAHTAVWTGTRMIVWGGSIHNDVAGTGAIYDPLTDAWSTISNVGAPRPRQQHTAIWTGSEMIVWGGDGWTDGVSIGGRYDPVTNTWSPMSQAGAPNGRRSHAAVWTGSEMIVWGGVQTNGGPSTLQTGGRYDPVSDSWTPTSLTDAPPASQGATAVWTGSEMIVWGGSEGLFSGDALRSGGRYDPVSDSWTATNLDGAPLARTGHSAVWSGDEMIIFAGISAGGTGGRYDPQSDSWTATSLPNFFGTRYNHAAFWTGSEMIIWGGDGGSGTSDERGDGELYDPQTDSWSPVSALDAPTPRTQAGAVWTGEQLIVWGGRHSGRDYVTGGRYDLASDSWTPTHVSDAPALRQDHAAVWTGNELIVWGGIAPGRLLYQAAPLADGARYDPLVDTWTPTSVAGAPTARYGHEAVWTGSEMVLWGGIDSAHTDTGARYDPLLDQWSAITTTGAPAAREQHTATWTGSEMVVFGGQLDSGDVTSTGARYNPGTDSWTSLPTFNAPEARRLHTSVWADGDVMIWGGLGETTRDPIELDSGSRYSTSLNAWIRIPRFDAPGPRYGHVSVWTGSELIVWGGRNDTDQATLGNGGRFERNAGVWQALDDAGAPEGRRFASAVWTDEGMFVWGGDSSDFLELSSGGRYDDATDSWSASSLLGAPQGRLDSTLVWTGDAAILWGGHVGGHGLNTGGFYAVGNPDLDVDGVADGCDCAPSDPGVFAAPGDIGGLVFDSDKETLSWGSLAAQSGSATLYDAIRGSLSQLPVGGTGETCLETGGADLTLVDSANPAAGEGFTYLVRGRNACGSGSYGFSSDGAERTTNVCP